MQIFPLQQKDGQQELQTSGNIPLVLRSYFQVINLMQNKQLHSKEVFFSAGLTKMSKTIVLHRPLNLFFFSSDSWTPFRDTFVAAPISTNASCSRWLFLSISHFSLISPLLEWLISPA